MERVQEQMPARMELGVQRYGKLLHPMNGRDFGRDVLEELLDLSVYLEGLLVEREAMFSFMEQVASAEMGTLSKQAHMLLDAMGAWGREGREEEVTDEPG